jgi:hypothetical protein
MKTRLSIGIGFVLFLLAAGIASARGIPSPAGNPPGQIWVTSHISTDPDAGSHVSIAIDESNGNTPWIAYYNQTYGSLMVAHYAGEGNGNCEPNQDWVCEQVDYAWGEAKGFFTSIAVHPGGSDWKVGVSYYDLTHRSLKYAEYTCTNPNTCAWRIDTVDSSSDPIDDTGRYTALKFSSDGVPHISYYTILDQGDPTKVEMVKYASYVGTGGNCGSGNAWECQVVIDVLWLYSTGKYTSLDLDWQDKPFISYFDETNGDLFYAYHTGSGGNCGLAGEWQCSLVDDGDGDAVGLFSSLHASQSAGGELGIAYYNQTAGQLMYARYLGSGGDCGQGSSWSCSIVDRIGANFTQLGISLAMDADNQPLIAYMDGHIDQAPLMLKVATPAYSMPYANCGGELFNNWYCQVVDNGYQDISEARYAGLAIKPNGLAAIAYSETDQSDYPARTYLKIASQMTKTLLPLVMK